ncbi:MAG: 3-deoxy-manno-octulosonate cytidylyltransferase [bacterium]|nr:3-deoxy-manno-octulosonate cytidylyltransferase [bacterium]
MKTLVVIPARYGSTRFPGKALADIHGKPLVVRVAEKAAGIKKAQNVVVATDDIRIFDAVKEAGFIAEMTGNHSTGTDRIGEVASRHAADIIVNLQGDEPLLDPKIIDHLIQTMLDHPELDLATCAHPFSNSSQWEDPNCVKVIVDRNNQALYFSRAGIPGNFPGSEPHGSQVAMRHVGIYAYRAQALSKFLNLDPTPLEKAEGLEQLRILENGMKIKVLKIDQEPVGVDTPEDLELVLKMWND